MSGEERPTTAPMSEAAPHRAEPLGRPPSLPVSVVVVNYNGGRGIERALRSLLQDPARPLEILVVDNASTDDSLETIERVAQTDPLVRLIPSSTNRGYAGAVNLALETARGEFLAVLNMDIEVTAGWLTPLVERLASPSVGAVNPLITLTDGRTVNAIGQDIHVTGLGFNRGLGQSVAEVGREPFAISGIHGSAFVLRTSLLRRLGGMDEAGFLYHEDVNLSWLLRLTGHELFCVPDSMVQHDYFLSMYPEKFHLLERNRLALLLTHLRWESLLLLAPLIFFTEGLAWAYSLLRGLPFAAAKLAGYRWLLARREALRKRRAWIEDVRTVSDKAVLRRLHVGYRWRQFLTLGRERGESQRKPVGGLRLEAEKDDFHA